MISLTFRDSELEGSEKYVKNSSIRTNLWMTLFASFKRAGNFSRNTQTWILWKPSVKRKRKSEAARKRKKLIEIKTASGLFFVKELLHYCRNAIKNLNIYFQPLLLFFQAKLWFRKYFKFVGAGVLSFDNFLFFTEALSFFSAALTMKKRTVR